MTMINTAEAAGSGQRLLPALNLQTLLTVLLAGVVSLVVWEIWARGISPAIGYGELRPTDLATAVLGKLFGVTDKSVAHIAHYLTGLVAYPAAYVLAVRPLTQRLLPFVPWWIVAAIFGVGTFVFALYVMAHLVMGWAPFLGWGTVAQTSLVGHTLLGLALGATAHWRTRRQIS